MITLRDLQEAIAECKWQRNPNAQTCLKLAAYYIIEDHMKPPAHSYATGETIRNEGESEFARAVSGKSTEEVIRVMDDLMETLQVIHPKLYDDVIRKLKGRE